MTELDHVTFRTSCLPETRDFLLRLFDLTEGPRPRAIQPIPGHWLYSNGKPIVHLIGTHRSMKQIDGEMIDHIAFVRSDYEDFIKRLALHSLPYSSMLLVELNEHRIFIRAPGRQLIEVVFCGQDAQTALHQLEAAV